MPILVLSCSVPGEWARWGFRVGCALCEGDNRFPPLYRTSCRQTLPTDYDLIGSVVPLGLIGRPVFPWLAVCQNQASHLSSQKPV